MLKQASNKMQKGKTTPSGWDFVWTVITHMIDLHQHKNLLVIFRKKETF